MTALEGLPTCSTCKHWDRDVEIQHNTYYYPTYRDGESAKEESARQVEVEKLYGTCRGVDEIPDSEDFEPPNTPPIAFTMDASRYTAELHTQATFGCLLHEENNED